MTRRTSVAALSRSRVEPAEQSSQPSTVFRRGRQNSIRLAELRAIVSAGEAAALRDDVFHYFAVDISKAEIAACIAISQALVIHSQQVQNGRVQVVNRNPILHSAESKLVSSIGQAALYAAARP